MLASVESRPAGRTTNDAYLESLNHALEDMCGAAPEDNSTASFHFALYAATPTGKKRISHESLGGRHKHRQASTEPATSNPP
jgi:hypothetical protein